MDQSVITTNVLSHSNATTLPSHHINLPGRFVKDALDMRWILGSWKISALIGVLVRDSVVYLLLYAVLVRAFLWMALTVSI